MKNDSDALRFSPQVMALAMPSESGFTKAAEGIGNVGKVFQEQHDREQAAALNALKVQGAQEELKSKQFENAHAQEKFNQSTNTYLYDLHNKKLDGLKKQMDYDSEVKKAGELEVTNTIKGMIPTTMFYKEGKFDRSLLDGARDTWLKDPKWAGKGHIVNAVFDGKLKEISDAEEAVLKNSKTQAETEKLQVEASTIKPKADAYVAAQGSVVTKNLAGANYDNTRASLAPRETAVREQNAKSTQQNADKNDPNNPKTWEQNIAMGRMKNLVAGYDDLSSKQKQEVDDMYRRTGKLPSNIRPLTDDESDKYSGTHRAVYTVPATPKAPPKAPVKTTSSTSPKIGDIKVNKSTGQRAQWDGKGYVLIP